MPDPVKKEILPPLTLISSAAKSVADSDSVNVNVAVSPAFNETTSEVIPNVGITVSTAVSYTHLRAHETGRDGGVRGGGGK